MLHRLAQQRITSSHLEWPFHQNQHYPQSASRDLSAVADVLVWISAISLLTRLACDRRIVDPSVKWLTLKAVRPRYMFVILIDFWPTCFLHMGPKQSAGKTPKNIYHESRLSPQRPGRWMFWTNFWSFLYVFWRLYCLLVATKLIVISTLYLTDTIKPTSVQRTIKHQITQQSS